MTSRDLVVLGYLAASLAGCEALVGVEDWKAEATSATGAGASGGGGPEDCPTGYVCAPPAMGWLGPVVLALDPMQDGSPASCPDEAPDALGFGPTDPTVPDAECGACTCAPASGGSCSDPVAVAYADDGCTTGPTQLSGPGCFAITDNMTLTLKSIVGTQQTTTGAGSCAAGGGGNTLAPVSFAYEGTLCGGPKSSCAGGLCGARAQAPFVGPCVYADGDQPECPSGYEERHLLTNGPARDGRACSACGCSPPWGRSCAGGSIALFSDSNCNNAVGLPPSVPLDGACTPDDVIIGSAQFTTPTEPAGGMCDPTGGAPTGDVTFTSPKTVCCAPR